MSEQESSDLDTHGSKPLSVADITKMLASMEPLFVATTSDDKIKNSPATAQTQTQPAEILAPTQYSPAKQLTGDELAARDRSAIAYSKSLMEVGNTLVYITYPTHTILFDHTGFPLTKKPNRVHSANLLATGSKVFRDLLLNDWKQHRARKRKGFLNKAALPSGIEYILDLTPPDEGDEAVDLISDLSCSPGICHWYSAEQRWGVHHSLVGGKDEIAKPRAPVAEIDKPITPDLLEQWPAPFAPDESTVVGDWASGPSNDNMVNQDKDLAYLRILRRSKEEHIAAATANMQFDPEAKQRALKVEEVQEYCPFRHRAGIEKLLQVIEGKDPRLDSAPKVWTLFVLAKYFDCTNKVLDHIVSWILAEPNCQFIEILPEVSYKIGNGLQSIIIARPAFAILVSEEAMNIASRMSGKFDAAKQRTSRFLRVKEDIDENSLNAIQASAHEFQSRVQGVFDNLVDHNMDWFSKLPEYNKLEAFMRHCGQYSFSKTTTNNLIANLRAYVRGRILSIITYELPYKMVQEANSHRRIESYLKLPTVDFQDIYSSLADRERVMTKLFWRMVRDSNWNTSNYSSNAFDTQYRQACEMYEVKETSMLIIGGLQLDVNSAILLAIKQKNFNRGVIPYECYQYDIFEGLETPNDATQNPFRSDDGTSVTDSNSVSFEGGQHLRRRSSSSDWGLDLYSSNATGKASSSAVNTWKLPVDSHKKENEKTSDNEPLTYLYAISEKQPGPIQAWEEVAASVFAESKNVDPAIWNRRVTNVKANFERNAWFVPSHPFYSDEQYFEYLAHLDQERDTNKHWRATQASKKVKYTETYAGSLDRLYEFPHRPREFEGEASDEEPLLQKTPKRPTCTDLQKSARPESPTLNLEKDSYPHSTGVEPASKDDSLYDEKLLNCLSKESEKVVSPISTGPPKKQGVRTFGKVKKIFSGSSMSSLSRPNIEEKTTDRDCSPSTGLYSTKSYADRVGQNSTSLMDPHFAPQSNPIAQYREGRVPKEININTQSPFFSISNFLVEVSTHVRAVSSEMLSNGEVDFCALTDTLLCLKEDEYKYLPLWAGGNEDGSGGVYDPEMPPAHLGPNGPGPAYHTGFSANSRASTEVDWDGSSSVDTSIAVNNGYSDHIDRRIVQSDDGFGTSVTFSEDFEDYGHGDIKGKGKAVEHLTPKTSTASSVIGKNDPTPKTSTPYSAIDDDNFMDVSDDDEVQNFAEEVEYSDDDEEWDDDAFA